MRPTPATTLRTAFALGLAWAQLSGIVEGGDVVVVRPRVVAEPVDPRRLAEQELRETARRLASVCGADRDTPLAPDDLRAARRPELVAALLEMAIEAKAAAPPPGLVCVLAAAGPDSVAPSVEFLARPYDARIEFAAAVAEAAVARLGMPAAEALAALLATPDCGPRTRVTARLLGSAPALPLERLRRLWLEHPNSCAATAAGQVLAYSGDRRLQPDFAAQASSTTPWIRVPAIVGLVTLGDPTGLPLANEALRDANSDTHMLAAHTLRPLLGRTEVRTLLARCARESPSCSLFAAQVLYFDSPDPVGRRLGARYAETQVPLVLRLLLVTWALAMAEQLALHALLTGLVVAVVAGEAALGRPSGGRLAALCGVVVSLGVGWGAIPSSVFGRHEAALLVSTAVAATAYALLRKARGAVAGPGSTRRWLLVVGAFYASFALGLAWLWGWLGS